MKIYAVSYSDMVTYHSEYYGFYSTYEKAEQAIQIGQADEDYDFTEDWEVKEIELDK